MKAELYSFLVWLKKLGLISRSAETDYPTSDILNSLQLDTVYLGLLTEFIAGIT